MFTSSTSTSADLSLPFYSSISNISERNVLHTFVCYKSVNSKKLTTLRLLLVFVAVFSLTTIGNWINNENQELLIYQINHHTVPGNYVDTAFENADQQYGNVRCFIFLRSFNILITRTTLSKLY
ncbi:unnamed protein product [Didymodactylos carnosus]|uniref:Uncharacterized protein n=1 Tax=Didymodactylos carnosus TaxID=1234261 RepID=A0A814FI52_9BILA|nr:unnamed protein product [Didymodactylos carnosus]CAF0983162.1 unnamed protein product [Didymodactylos carnosus]CAF3661393.1 unnamed protein product [Didymodactylos carnosus]CAF3755594.1 unnamed protein product [Didymodactylos carnosus]